MNMKARSRSSPGSQASPMAHRAAARPKASHTCRRQARVSPRSGRAGEGEEAAAGELPGSTGAAGGSGA